ncbi:MAG TPA: hypothetical protein VFF68_06950 [Anaerolineaceae bacterium]|nr:hypothetical protein [Anaerolineaceae bacterium]
MIKRIVILVAAASLISAGILFVGFSILGQTSQAQAFALEALVTGGEAQPEPVQQQTATAAATVSATVPATTATVSTETPPSATPQPLSGVSIAQLLGSPAQYLNQVFTLRGIAADLTGEKFLLNDGTGQILVDLENDIARRVAVDGQTVTVTGRFDDSSGGFKLEVFSLTDESGATFTDFSGDDSHDDSNSGSGSSGSSGDDSGDDLFDDKGSDRPDDDDHNGDNSGSGSSSSGSSHDDNSGSDD